VSIAKFTLALVVLAFICGCGSKSSLSPAAPAPAAVTPTPILQSIAANSAPSLVVKVQDYKCSQLFCSYAYAPSIIYTQGTYHAFFCATGAGGNDWDNIMHATSADLVTWSAPDLLLVPTNYERSNCDPSVVFNKADGFYYIFYGGCVAQDQTVVFVARSTNPDGPFLKYTQRGTWEANPSDSQIVIAPINPTTSSSYYGAGQPSVAIRDGVWTMFYSDDTAAAPGPGQYKTYKSTSLDGLTWTQGTLTNVAPLINSVDVKWDASNSQWVMIEVVNQFGASSLVMQTSTDGVNWAEPQVIQAAGSFPAGANNPGISGDDQGYLMNGQVLVAYGAPYTPSQVNATTGIAGTWGQWDLWGSMLAASSASRVTR
jgi:hypothetical protein